MCLYTLTYSHDEGSHVFRYACDTVLFTIDGCPCECLQTLKDPAENVAAYTVCAPMTP
jgi:hypothetical protein